MSKHYRVCMGCENRALGCHATCEKYLEEVKVCQQEKEQIYAAKGKNREYYSYKKSIEKRFR